MSDEKNMNLMAVDVSGFTEKKGNLTYLSWSYAWAEVLRRYPDATWSVDLNPETNLPAFGSENAGYMVYTTVTINGISRKCQLYVMDYRNNPILKPNVKDINTTVMRCLTKTIAFFGLGLNVYAGEDLPMDSDELKEKREKEKKQDEEDQKKYDDDLSKKISATDAVIVKNLIVSQNIDEAKLLEMYKISDVSEMTKQMMANFNVQLAKAEAKREKSNK